MLLSAIFWTQNPGEDFLEYGSGQMARARYGVVKIGISFNLMSLWGAAGYLKSGAGFQHKYMEIQNSSYCIFVFVFLFPPSCG